MSDSDTPEPPPPPLWGEAVFTRGDGAVIAAQIKVSAHDVRIETGDAALARDEILTGPNGQRWLVAEAKVSAAGTYSWATLIDVTDASDTLSPPQQPLNQIAPEPEPAPAPTRRRKADAADADAASEPRAEPAEPEPPLDE